jgi:hypothetical protein
MTKNYATHPKMLKKQINFLINFVTMNTFSNSATGLPARLAIIRSTLAVCDKY